MRLAAYLSRSRHGVFYFRWPIPMGLHPDRKRSHLRLSLHTRCPAAAQHLSRMLALSGASETGLLSGQSRSAAASVRAMRYSEIREHLRAHFTEKLRRFEDGVDENGPPDAERREKIKDTAALAEMDWQDWSDLIGHGEASKEIRAFCAERGLASDALPPKALGWVQDGLRSGLGWYWQKAIEHVEGLDRFDAPAVASTPQPGGTAMPDVQEAVEAISYQEVVDQYFLEIQRSGGLAPRPTARSGKCWPCWGKSQRGSRSLN